MESLTPQAARNLPLLDDAVRDLVASQIAARLLTLASPMPEQVGSIAHQTIAGPDSQLLLRMYTPEGDGPFPVLVFFFGGGFVIGSLEHADATARALSNAAKCIVVTPAYRQAPESKFPAAVEDAVAATQWVMAQAGRFSGDVRRVAVGGASAGGNLAAVVSQIARDHGGPVPVHQLLIYPMVHWAFDTPSYEEHALAKPLSSAKMAWFMRHYLRDEADRSNPKASPLLAQDLSALPPATIITAENDPLRDDGRLYADKLSKAGVPVSYHHYSGVMHGFFGLAGILPKAKDAVQQAAANLRVAFADPDEDVDLSGPAGAESQPILTI